MKKGVIALLLALAVIILISPGIIGKLAEQSVDENLNWAATESGELIVTSQDFDRGWFSSEGQHRIELGDGTLRAAVAADGKDFPALVINTHLDHGPVAFTSMAREGGSLAPGLGSAVSTLVVEYGKGETFEIPGSIYSEIGLGGGLQSRYALEAGTKTTDGKTATWEAVSIDVSTSPRNGSVSFDGNIGALSFTTDQEVVSVDSIIFSGEQTQTQYGFATGTLDAAVGAVAFTTGGMQRGGMNGLTVTANSAINDSRLDADVQLQINEQNIPGFGDVSVTANIVIADADAKAVGVVSQRLESMSGSQDPTQTMMMAEEDFKDLVAAGFEFRFDQLDLVLPMGTVRSRISFEIPQSDRATFEWTSLLLGIVASADIKVPQALVDIAMTMNPQGAEALIGMGYLKLNGNAYEMEARYKKGVLTVNGAPVPIPLGALMN